MEVLMFADTYHESNTTFDKKVPRYRKRKQNISTIINIDLMTEK